MGIRKGRDGIIAVLSSATYAANAATLSAALGDVTIGAFAEVVGYRKDQTQQHPSVQVEPNDTVVDGHEKTGARMETHSYTLRVETRSQTDPEDAWKQLLAHINCITATLNNRDAASGLFLTLHGTMPRVVTALTMDIDYDTLAADVNNAVIAGATMNVDVVEERILTELNA